MGFGGFGFTNPSRYLGHWIGDFVGPPDDVFYYEAVKVFYHTDDFSGDLSAYIGTANASIVSGQVKLPSVSTGANRGQLQRLMGEPTTNFEYVELGGTISAVDGSPGFTIDWGDSEISNSCYMGFTGLTNGVLRFLYGGSFVGLSGGWSVGDDLKCTMTWDKTASPAAGLRTMDLEAFVNGVSKATKTIDINIHSPSTTSVTMTPVRYFQVVGGLASGSTSAVYFDDIFVGFADIA